MLDYSYPTGAVSPNSHDMALTETVLSTILALLHLIEFDRVCICELDLSHSVHICEAVQVSGKTYSAADATTEYA
jgi:hypothetical protein